MSLPDPTEAVDVALADGVLWLTLTRPERLNALDGPMMISLIGAFEGAIARDDVRAVVLQGSGGSFSAGADVGDEQSWSALDGASVDAANRLVRAITGLDKPVIAGVNGFAAGFGLSIALACDLVVAAESAQLLLAFARVGLMPDGGTTYTVAASVGRAKAMRMALLAEPLAAADAFAQGLVSHLVPDAELEATVASLAKRLAFGPPLAFAATKRAINQATLAGLEAALEQERTSQTVLLRTSDAAEGMRAFGEKRKPRFEGR